MQKIVLAVLNKSSESMNGRSFQKYRVKMYEDMKSYITDLFVDSDSNIAPGDVLEDMTVIGHMNKSELDVLPYEKMPVINYKSYMSEEKPRNIVENTKVRKKDEQLTLFRMIGCDV